jgi:HTH-type transcriptional regulator/antitoxin HigA
MASEIKNEYFPKKVSHPGETLADLLDERNMSQTALARRTGRPVKTINEIVNGKTGITPQTAIELERALGVPASFWNTRQKQYDEYIKGKAERNRLKGFLGLLERLPIKEMVAHGYIAGSSDKIALLEQVLNFLGVVSPKAFEEQCLSTAVRYRKSAAFQSDEYALAAWLRRGHLLAERLECKPYNRTAFKAVLSRIRSLTRLTPIEFVPRLQRMCSEVGVAVVFVPELPKIRAFGASYWISGTPVIQLCLRGRKDDILWFTFFHEAGHIILHERKKAIYLEVNDRDGEEEDEASRFASELLIPRSDLERFISVSAKITTDSIISFADRLGIAPSIVVGQLHHFRYVPYTHFQKLRVTLKWESSN